MFPLDRLAAAAAVRLRFVRDEQRRGRTGHSPTRLTPRSGWLRVLRGTAVAGVSMVLTVTGHAQAGGAAPDAGLVLVLGLLLAGVLVGLADRQPSLRCLLLTLGGVQLAMHALLSALGVHGTHHHTVTSGAGAASLQMLTAHLVATLVTGWLMHSADRAVFAIAALLGRVMPRRSAPPAVAAAITIVLPLHAARGSLIDVLLRRVRPLRGPPVSS